MVDREVDERSGDLPYVDDVGAGRAKPGDEGLGVARRGKADVTPYRLGARVAAALLCEEGAERFAGALEHGLGEVLIDESADVVLAEHADVDIAVGTCGCASEVAWLEPVL